MPILDLGLKGFRLLRANQKKIAREKVCSLSAVCSSHFSEMKHSRVLLQASFFLLLLLITPSQGGTRQLQKWLDNPRTTSILFRKDSSIALSERDVMGRVIKEVERTGPIIVGVCEDKHFMWIYSGEKRLCQTVMSQELQSLTNYLPMKENGASYLLLEAAPPFYITDQLSGCDVWIAERPNSRPLTIHINSNENANDPSTNLYEKERLAEQVLGIFNDGHGNGYRFVLRLSYNYAKNLRPPCPIQSNEINNYWNDFGQRYPDLPLGHHLYDNPGTLFYGMYHDRENLWVYSLKDVITGNVAKIGCRVDTPVKCIIQ